MEMEGKLGGRGWGVRGRGREVRGKGRRRKKSKKKMRVGVLGGRGES